MAEKAPGFFDWLLNRTPNKFEQDEDDDDPLTALMKEKQQARIDRDKKAAEEKAAREALKGKVTKEVVETEMIEGSDSDDERRHDKRRPAQPEARKMSEEELMYMLSSMSEDEVAQLMSEMDEEDMPEPEPPYKTGGFIHDDNERLHGPPRGNPKRKKSPKRKKVRRTKWTYQ